MAYRLTKFNVPPEYEAIDNAVEGIWSLHPILVIHCGVYRRCSCVHLDKLAYNNHFRKKDFAGKYLPDARANLQNNPTKKTALFCKLNVHRIVQVVSEKRMKLAKVSKDIGNYLCGYIYLKSLDYDRSRTLFVHVPPVGKPFPVEKLSDVVLKIIEECLRQVVDGVEKEDKGF
ncbi:pyroglutamyl-peptidase 1-like [Musca vetustissima]|uniref:pyroglutamyl-peptidase 1-like n=1 Tax=Musca vetustissima TaxID=27455 RepID=UPI002AB69569|nr:pyroglutamyl-peptidase 1-like [Musca vetustissima]